ncbi:tetratricopeptide repeat protein [Isoalcanivorax indicus]|uniref:tetratricopeptide repeat protein n=1 Tax=Isoalcanivorax indicus TaxID=2202653 RepID=UPI000DBA1DAD|nr:tetratricopeptide repeat protein [Isoalcanivorax indicus]
MMVMPRRLRSLVRLWPLVLILGLSGCASMSERGTLAQLQRVSLDLEDARIEGGIERAMQSYQRFLEETPESAMTPEALRRLADLKLEREYGVLEVPSPAERPAVSRGTTSAPAALARPAQAERVAGRQMSDDESSEAQESLADFESRATQMDMTAQASSFEHEDELANRGAEEAIALYQQLLEQYPYYERNDQVLYQMTRAYDELGRTEEAVAVMDRIVAQYPRSRVIDEVQFRRGEFFFTRNRFLDAEDAYQAVVRQGSTSFYYEMARYKLGWTFYKQDMLEEGLDQFVALLDYKLQTGYDFDNPGSTVEQQRLDDTHRVISLSFSALGGPETIVEYFEQRGARRYEVDIYRNLGEHYLETRRYSDAASAYKTFVDLNPFHRLSPHFDMRVIEIYKQGGFPILVIEANKDFANSYGLKSEYWTHFDVEAFPDVLALLKDNLQELANYYHALYQNPQFSSDRAENFREAQHWYREFLTSFPREDESPVMNYQFADLLLENRSYGEAAREYERTAYDYPQHEQAAAAGYAAVYAHRQHLQDLQEEESIKRDVIRSSLRFAETFPTHDSASLVMGAALEDIFAMNDHAFAVTTGHKMLDMFPEAPAEERRAAWLVVAHSSYELARYPEAETAYLSVLALTDDGDDSRAELVENLAASIYRQGDLASEAGEHRQAADHYLRLGHAAPNSRLRPAAEYDAAQALMALEAWDDAIEVLTAFRRHYPQHRLQPDITKNLAHVYGEAGQLSLAAREYERIERESDNEDIRREALKVAADLYEQVDEDDEAIRVYRRFISHFPQPLGPVVEMHHKVALLLQARGDTNAQHAELRQIVALDNRAGEQRDNRMRYLAGHAALTLAEPGFKDYVAIRLTQPFERTLVQKRNTMRELSQTFTALVNYEVGEVTAAATWYVAEIYYEFSRALMDSERPAGMDELEMEQYEELLDEQAYPFEERAIGIHQQNIALIDRGIFNRWVDRSVTRLADIVPGRYARFEESSGFIAGIRNVSYESLTHPSLPEPEQEPEEEPAAVEQISADEDAQEIELAGGAR